ncbi:arylsulfatase [Pontiella agarivorans]|uniref:Arylsulfatase n=1 Tax=Pontiella agarivorans TaxID=3038953 RepID=A0ABU5MXZ1_9BACT|nr:arylsulfatase [Pontiella agarivorans]MDZ8119067.1 arylsulfatase [Pontiella agarivorans]
MKTVLLAISCSIMAYCTMAAARPNVVLLITDDQGYGDLSCHGNPVLKTPNLDKLHEQSVRLTDFHLDPMCAPSRTALLTGRYSARAGVWSTLNGCYIPPRTEVTLGHLFSANGYDTSMFGKWHLGDAYPYSARYRGFNYVVRHGAGVVGEVPDHWGNTYFNDTYLKNGEWEQFDGYCTDVWFEEAIKHIKSVKGKPFFCYLAPNAPHNPFNVDERYSKPYLNAGVPEQRARFYGMIANIDENVGRLLSFLEEEGLAENTIILFMGDNGTSGGADIVWKTSMVKDGYNAGMRGKKMKPYEGGHRNSCFIRWPAGGISGGRDVGGLSAHFDLFPTLAELCDLNIPSAAKLDGISLAPQLRGDESVCPERTLVTHNMQLVEPVKYKDFCVMDSRWRLVSPGLSEKTELFDIQADPGQLKDLSADYPEVAKRLRKKYDAWWNEMLPVFGTVSRHVVGSPHENPMELNCHSWKTPSKEMSYDQLHVRQGIAINDAYWPIEIERAGRYRIELRRWPRDADVPIVGTVPALHKPFCDPLPAGKVYPIVKARLAVQDFDLTIPVSTADKAAVFELEFKAGQSRLQAWFAFDADQTINAYYVTVRWLGP